MANRWRGKNAQPYERDDFLLKSVEDAERKKFEKIVGTLSAVARERPPGWKNKRPGHVSKAERKKQGKKR